MTEVIMAGSYGGSEQMALENCGTEKCYYVAFIKEFREMLSICVCDCAL